MILGPLYYCESTVPVSDPQVPQGDRDRFEGLAGFRAIQLCMRQ
jgi:hypothetical protein